MDNKTVYVGAKFKPVGKYENVRVSTGETKRGVLGGTREVMQTEKKWVQTGFSDREIDGELLAQELQQAISQLNNEGYEVVSITEVTSGNYSWQTHVLAAGGWGYGYGYSYTEGLIVVARRCE